jgi:hypothetical protein
VLALAFRTSPRPRPVETVAEVVQPAILAH